MNTATVTVTTKADPLACSIEGCENKRRLGQLACDEHRALVCVHTTDDTPTFERCADKTLNEVRSIYAERGVQYADTWDPKNAAMHFTREAFAALKDLRYLEPREAQLLQLACLIDVKISRMTGGYKSDTIADLVAYLACYKTLREEYESA